MNEYDVVLSTLEEKKQELWNNTELGDIRLEQIQEINEAMGMWLLWKDEKNANVGTD